MLSKESFPKGITDGFQKELFEQILLQIRRHAHPPHGCGKSALMDQTMPFTEQKQHWGSLTQVCDPHEPIWKELPHLVVHVSVWTHKWVRAMQQHRRESCSCSEVRHTLAYQCGIANGAEESQVRVSVYVCACQRETLLRSHLPSFFHASLAHATSSWLWNACDDSRGKHEWWCDVEEYWWNGVHYLYCSYSTGVKKKSYHWSYHGFLVLDVID